VRERLGHDVALRPLHDLVVPDGRRRPQSFFGIARFDNALFLRVVGPDPGVTIGLQLEGDGQLIVLPLPLHDGLGWFPGSFNPHAQQEGRLDAYCAAIAAGSLPPGWAVDDGAALHYINGALARVLRASDAATKDSRAIRFGSGAAPAALRK